MTRLLDVTRDARYGARLLLKNPESSAVALVTLALGIGVTSAVFTIVHAVMLGLEHRVKAACELAIAIANQKPNRLLPLNESPRDLPRLLRDPRIVGMCRAAGQVDAAAAEFNENSTYSRWSHTVSTVKKSTAMMLLACVRRNSRHDGPRRTVGPSPSARRIFLTVVAETTTLRPFSSPTMR